MQLVGGKERPLQRTFDERGYADMGTFEELSTAPTRNGLYLLKDWTLQPSWLVGSLYRPDTGLLVSSTMSGVE